MRLSDLTRKYIALSFALFILVGLFVAGYIGSSQDRVYAEDSRIFSEIVNNLQNGDYSSALDKSLTLEKRQKNTEMYNYISGIIAINLGETEKSLRHFQRVLDINPYKVEDSMFMLQYAEILFSAEKMSEAQKVLERCEKLAVPESFPQYQEIVAQLLEQIGEQS